MLIEVNIWYVRKPIMLCILYIMRAFEGMCMHACTALVKDSRL